MVVTASCGIEPTRLVYYKPILDEAIRLSSYKPSTCIVYQRDQVTVNQISFVFYSNPNLDFLPQNLHFLLLSFSRERAKKLIEWPLPFIQIVGSKCKNSRVNQRGESGLVQGVSIFLHSHARFTPIFFVCFVFASFFLLRPKRKGKVCIWAK